MACIELLNNIRLFICLILLTFTSNYTLSAQVPRVRSVEVLFSTKNYTFSVPTLLVGEFSRVILNGSFSNNMHVAFTKKTSNHAKVCTLSELLNPAFDPVFNGLAKNIIEFNVSAILTNKFSEYKDLFICIIDINNTKPLWIHQGEASRIHIFNKNTRRKDRLPIASQYSRTLPSRRIPVPVSRNDNGPKIYNDSEVFNVTDSPRYSSTLRTLLGEKSARTFYFYHRNKSDIRTSADGASVPLYINHLNSENIISTNSNSDLQNISSSVSNKDINVLFSGLQVLNQQGSSNKERDLDVSKPPSSAPENSLDSKPIKGDKSVGSPKVFGLRVESHSKGISYQDGSIELLANEEAVIRLFGFGLTKDVAVQFTASEGIQGGRCDITTSKVFKLEDTHGDWAQTRVSLPVMTSTQNRWYICVRIKIDAPAVHQGSDSWLTITTYAQLLPIWIQVIILFFLLVFSGLFSGLNLGLMSLDKTELKIVMNTGTPTEREYARSIEPVRRHGNFLLCTLLLGNVLVNSSLTILLDTLSTGLIAVIGSTIGIVIFGEIVPQAICSRHGLSVGAKTVWLVRIFMVITGVVAWPISKLLDKLLGEEIGNTYNRDRLKELIRVTQDRNDLRLEEQNIIYGALELHQKTAAEIMTKLEDTFMLSIDTNLDFNTISEIMQQGYSRIPIYDGERTNIVSLLLIKDMAFIDPDDNTPLRTVTQYYQNSCNYFFEDTTLDVIFKEFKHGNKGHMAFVQRVNNEGDCDPFYEVVGVVTLEDIIEELIQEEIVDETDVFTDNKSKRRRKQIRRNFKEFSQHSQNTSHKRVQIAPQLQVAAFQFLRTTVEPFKEGYLSEGILKKMLNQDIVHILKGGSSDGGSNPAQRYNFIYVQGKPTDFFVLILEGHVEVTLGKENLTFESGPFAYFGLTALSLAQVGDSPSLSTHLSRGSVQSLESTKYSFTPDYSVKTSSQVTFLKVKRSLYIAAHRAFLVEQSQKGSVAGEAFEKEMEKILRDESQSSPVWDSIESRDSREYSREPILKDTLLNGGSGVQSRSRSADQVEITSLGDDRKLSLKEMFPLKSFCSPNSPNPLNKSLPPGGFEEEPESHENPSTLSVTGSPEHKSLLETQSGE